MRNQDQQGGLHAALVNGYRLMAASPASALEQAEAILAVTPGQADALLLAVVALRRLGRIDEAAALEPAAIDASASRPALAGAATAMTKRDFATAERLARAVLRDYPNDIAASFILGDLAFQLGIHADAEKLLRRVTTLVPGFADPRITLATLLFQQRRATDALELLDDVLAHAPANTRAAAIKADLQAQLGDYDAAAETYRALLQQVPDHAEAWLWWGNLMKTTGRREEAIKAYRHALTLDPALTEAWWSLGEIKVSRLTADDIQAIEASLASEADPAKQVFGHFALGKAYEDAGEWSRSFEHYRAGNTHRRMIEPHDADAIKQEVDRSIALMTPEFFTKWHGAGAQSDAPIFIVGMPRAGSTLIEQILASHSLVEGTAELQYIPSLVQELLGRHWQDKDAAYPAILERLSATELRRLGEDYLAAAARHRKTDAPFFIDKLPNNWLYCGLIRLILPHAHIVDARRDPMACCFSNYKQLFSRGQTFSYDLTDMGRYYRDYVRMMDHLDVAIPGFVHRVQHEALVQQPQAEILRLLAFLGLDFEEACLRFHENTRPVRTASAEQVRRPISADGLNHWRHYDQWLGPLREALA